MEKCTAKIKVISISLEMSKDQAIALWDLVGGMKPGEAQKYISFENYEKLYKLWQTLDKELIQCNLVN